MFKVAAGAERLQTLSCRSIEARLASKGRMHLMRRAGQPGLVMVATASDERQLLRAIIAPRMMGHGGELGDDRVGCHSFSFAAAFGVGCEGDTSPPKGRCTATGRLPCANLLKAEQLREKSRRQSAVEQPEVNAGELVDSQGRLLVSAEMAREETGTWVKPPLRTKSIGFKVSEEGYARLEQRRRPTVGRSGSGAAR